MRALASCEPLQVAFGLRRLRRNLEKEMDGATGEELVAIAGAYVKVIDPLLRLCQFPTAPKGKQDNGGTNAKPVLDMAEVRDA